LLSNTAKQREGDCIGVGRACRITALAGSQSGISAAFCGRQGMNGARKQAELSSTLRSGRTGPSAERWMWVRGLPHNRPMGLQRTTVSAMLTWLSHRELDCQRQLKSCIDAQVRNLKVGPVFLSTAMLKLNSLSGPTPCSSWMSKLSRRWGQYAEY
jgi:hypothetical protein